MEIQPINQHRNIDHCVTDSYNATVVEIDLIHEELMIMRVRPDRGIPPIRAGQYTVLGLCDCEPRAPGCQDEGVTRHQHQLIRRAYSISCPLLNSQGNVAGINDLEFLEFYITLIRQSAHRPPALTPRIFALKTGSRIYCSLKLHGRYTTDDIPPGSTVIFAATGTGEAPHNAMVAQLLKANRSRRIVMVTCARSKADLGYLKVHRQLEKTYPYYQYIGLTTREPENLDATHPSYVGKRYLQDFFASGEFESAAGFHLDTENTHVFLCGNPAMIGAPVHTHDQTSRYAEPSGMVQTLEGLGFQIDTPHNRGNIHFEKYW